MVSKKSAATISFMQSSVVRKDFLEIRAELSGIHKALVNRLLWSGLQNGFSKILPIPEFSSLQTEKNLMTR